MWSKYCPANVWNIWISWDKGDAHSKPYRLATTNIYKTKDGRYFHLHGKFVQVCPSKLNANLSIRSMNPDPTIQSLGLPLQNDVASQEEAWTPFMEKVGQKTSQQIEKLANNEYCQADTICWTTEEYMQSAHGKANSHVGMYELHKIPEYTQPPYWWSSTAQTSAKRPLAGLKVIDLTRVIAAPRPELGQVEHVP